MPSASLTMTSYEEDEYDDGSSGAGDGSARTAFISMPRHGGESARALRLRHATSAQRVRCMSTEHGCDGGRRIIGGGAIRIDVIISMRSPSPGMSSAGKGASPIDAVIIGKGASPIEAVGRPRRPCPTAAWGPIMSWPWPPSPKRGPRSTSCISAAAAVKRKVNRILWAERVAI